MDVKDYKDLEFVQTELVSALGWIQMLQSYSGDSCWCLNLSLEDPPVFDYEHDGICQNVRRFMKKHNRA